MSSPVGAWAFQSSVRYSYLRWTQWRSGCGRCWKVASEKSVNGNRAYRRPVRSAIKRVITSIIRSYGKCYSPTVWNGLCRVGLITNFGETVRQVGGAASAFQLLQPAGPSFRTPKYRVAKLENGSKWKPVLGWGGGEGGVKVGMRVGVGVRMRWGGGGRGLGRGSHFTWEWKLHFN